MTTSTGTAGTAPMSNDPIEAAVKANLHPLAEPSSTELATMRRSIDAYLDVAQLVPAATLAAKDAEIAGLREQAEMQGRQINAQAAIAAERIDALSRELAEVKAERTYAGAVAPYAAALRMIREAIGELFGPAASLESEDAVLLRGPEPVHEAEAIISALQNLHATIAKEPTDEPD